MSHRGRNADDHKHSQSGLYYVHADPSVVNIVSNWVLSGIYADLIVAVFHFFAFIFKLLSFRIFQTGYFFSHSKSAFPELV